MSRITDFASDLNKLLERLSKAERLASDYAHLAAKAPPAPNQPYQLDHLQGMTADERQQHHDLYVQAAKAQHQATLILLSALNRQISEVARKIGGAA